MIGAVEWLLNLTGMQALLQSWGLGEAAPWLITSLIQCALLLNVIAVGALVFIWMERKVSGRIQDRLGPTRVGGGFGWLQTLADGLKLIQKEDLAPAGADEFLFRAAPYISFCASFTSLIALPFAANWVGVNLNIAVFFILAVIGLEVFGVILGGYASASKWSLFGAMREAAQVVSYEVPMGLCVAVIVLITGTMDLGVIANMQAGTPANWLIFHDPFTFCTFWVYFTCALASVNRAPFDLAEAESELVAGFLTEYSGLRWSYFFMAEYGSMFAVSALASIMFFGGWHGPVPLAEMLGYAGGDVSSAPWMVAFLLNLLGFASLMLKSVFFVTVMMWVRWTLPRLRIDQVMTMCLKYCIPLASVMFIGAGIWKASGGLDGLTHSTLGFSIVPRPMGEVREPWTLEAMPLPVRGAAPSVEAPIRDAAEQNQPNWPYGMSASVAKGGAVR